MGLGRRALRACAHSGAHLSPEAEQGQHALVAHVHLQEGGGVVRACVRACVSAHAACVRVCVRAWVAWTTHAETHVPARVLFLSQQLLSKYNLT